MSSATIRQNGTQVQIIVGARLIAEIPWQQALGLSEAIRTQAKRAEEWASAEQIATDQAILIRTGAPIGLSDHPKIQAEARKLAQWDSQLRRYIPQLSGIRTGESFGTPTIQHAPKKKGGING